MDHRCDARGALAGPVVVLQDGSELLIDADVERSVSSVGGSVGVV